MNLKTIWELAKQGNKKAQFELAERYEEVHIVYKAIELYEIVAQKNIKGELDESFYAKCSLVGYYWIDVLYGFHNEERALKWSLSILADLDAVKQDCSDIDLKECKAEYLFHVAQIYDVGTYQDDLKAMDYYKESALLSGDIYPVHIVGDFYLFRKKDIAEALKWFKQFKCYHTLGLYYRQGRGFKQDYSKALRYFKLSISARRETSYNDSDEAMYEIGNLYYNGWGVPKDYEEAAKWYRLAVKQMYGKFSDSYIMGK